MADARFPTMDGSTSSASLSYMMLSKTGSLPTQFGLMTSVTYCDFAMNQMTGRLEYRYDT